MYSGLSKQQLLSRLFSNAGVYGIGIILTRLGGVLLLPIYWQKLEPADFGIIGLSQIVTLFLSPVLSLGLYDAVQRLFFEWEAEDRPRYLAALWLTSIALSLLLCLGLEVFGGALFGSMLSQVPFSPYLEVTIWTAFAINLGLFPLTLLRLREQLKSFTLVTVASFITQAALILVFIFVFELKALGYLLGIMANGFLWGGYFLYFMAREIGFPIRLAHLSEPLRYSLPTVPASVLDGVGSVFDRVFLDKYASLAVIGFYNLGNQFGATLSSFNQIMKSSWVPLIFRVISDRSDGPAVLGRFSLYYVAAMAVPALAIALLSKELIVLFGNDRFAGIYPFVPYFVLVYYLQAVGTAMGRGLDLAKKTAYTPIVPAITFMANFVFLWLLVPRYGVWGAIASLLITTALRIGTHIGLALYFYPRPVFFWRLMSVFSIATLTFIAGNNMATGSLTADVALKCIVILVGTVAIAWAALDWDKAVALVKRRWRKVPESR